VALMLLFVMSGDLRMGGLKFVLGVGPSGLCGLEWPECRAIRAVPVCHGMRISFKQDRPCGGGSGSWWWECHYWGGASKFLVEKGSVGPKKVLPSGRYAMKRPLFSRERKKRRYQVTIITTCNKGTTQGGSAKSEGSRGRKEG